MSTDDERAAYHAPQTNRVLGERAERFVADAWETVRLVPDVAVGWYDAVTVDAVEREPAGTVTERGVPIEVKSCTREVSGGARRQRGRFWVKRSNHRRLLAADGEYALVLFSDDGTRVLRFGRFPASEVDEWLAGQSWWKAGPGRGYGTQFCWSRVWSPEFVDCLPGMEVPL
jgi:hypothetical protein